MSAAEQIVELHALLWRDNPHRRLVCTCGAEFSDSADGDAHTAHAAHVVAALTNAGHLLLGPEDVERLGMVLVYTPIHDKTRVPLQVLMRRYDESIAARAAEGGAA